MASSTKGVGRSGGDDGRDIMASIAARLGVKKFGAGEESFSPPTAHAPLPRTTPSLVTSNTHDNIIPRFHPTNSVEFTSLKENAPPVAPLATNKGTQVSTTGNDVNMADVNAGPSLRGSARKLADAREMNANFSQSKPARKRVGSSFSSASSISSPKRVAAATVIPRKKFSHPAVSPHRQPLASTRRDSMSSSMGSVTKGRPELLNGGTEMGNGHLSTSSPYGRNLAEARAAWQMAVITNTLTGRAMDHRAKAAAVADKETKPVVSENKPVPVQSESATHAADKSQPMVVDDAKTANQYSVPNGATASTTSVNGTDKSAESPKLASTPVSTTQAYGGEQPAPPAIPVHANGERYDVKAPAPPNPFALSDPLKSILDVVKSVTDQLVKTVERVTKLERDNFTMSKELEEMRQADERRKFLGTDDAKEPFALQVKCSDNSVHRIQVHAALKVFELVRRLRTTANLDPKASDNPRISIGGQQVGHGMTLGEVGVTKKNQDVEVVFSFDGVKDEDEYEEL